MHWRVFLVHGSAKFLVHGCALLVVDGTVVTFNVPFDVVDHDHGSILTCLLTHRIVSFISNGQSQIIVLEYGNQIQKSFS